MATELHRVAALGAAILFSFGITACSADSDKGHERVAGTPLMRACDGIFDQQMVKESRRSQVHVEKADSYKEAARYLLRPDSHKTYAEEQEVCNLTTTKKGAPSQLLSVSAVWRPIGPRNGNSVEWRAPFDGGRAAGHVVVDCRNPGGKSIRSAFDAIQLYLYNELLSLSYNSRAKLLIAAAKKLMPRMHCENKITYPDPDKVAPR
ncbi:hypothetical protein [Streptomyces sp. 3N207]|uniref:hypothetical protein n=1 Tax=Streptomyces sp. 3N207 TaxID=3457417 RepID=UPI003FD679C2